MLSASSNSCWLASQPKSRSVQMRTVHDGCSIFHQCTLDIRWSGIVEPTQMKCSSRGVEMSRLPVPKTLRPSSHAPSLVMLGDVTSCDNVTRTLLRVHVRSDMFHRPAYIIDADVILGRVLDRGDDTLRAHEVDWNHQV